MPVISTEMYTGGIIIYIKTKGMMNTISLRGDFSHLTA